MSETTENDKKFFEKTFVWSRMTLLLVAVFVFFYSIFTNDPTVRKILIIELIVLLIASFFYTKMIREVRKDDTDITKLVKYRYLDWAITTPLLLITLILFLTYFQTTTTSFPIYTIIAIFFCNWMMLIQGYFGEDAFGILDKNFAWITSFIFFVAIFALLYFKILRKKDNKPSMIKYILFSYFFILWLCYGLIYKLEERQRNIYLNLLDTFSKGFFGFFILGYFLYIEFMNKQRNLF
jgi:sensory rhodopsin